MLTTCNCQLVINFRCRIEEGIIMKKLIGLLLLTSATAYAGEVPDYIKQCADCHGNNGISTESDVPIIAGASATYIADSLFAYQDESRIAVESKFRDGDITRAATDMQKISKDLTEAQIEEIAEYFAGLPFVAAKQDFDAALAAKGAKVHKSRCKKCHEDGGSSVDDDSGILAGQWTPYLREAFKLYLSGERNMEKKMKVKMDKLNGDQVEALLNFYASQQ